MKTTIDIADPILKRAKRLAARREITLKELVEAALRDVLDREGISTGSATVRTPTFKGSGLRPGLTWEDWGTIRDLGYEGRGT